MVRLSYLLVEKILLLFTGIFWLIDFKKFEQKCACALKAAANYF